MNEQIKEYLDKAFLSCPESEKAVKLLKELEEKANTIYSDLISKGESKEAAFAAAISGLGDISKQISLLDIDQSIISPFTREEWLAKRKKSYILTGVSALIFVLALVLLTVFFNYGLEFFAYFTFFTITAAAAVLAVYAAGIRVPSPEDLQDALYRERSKTPLSKREKKALIFEKHIKRVISFASFFIYAVITVSTGAFYMTWLVFVVGALARRITHLLFKLWLNKKDIDFQIMRISFNSILAVAIIFGMTQLPNDCKSFEKLFSWQIIFRDHAKYTVDNIELYTPGHADIADEVSQLYISWPYGSVTIKPGSGSTLSAYDDRDSVNSDNMHWYYYEGTLYIRYSKSCQGNIDHDLVVELPSDSASLSGIKINSHNTNMNFQNINTDNIFIDTLAGSITLKSCKAYSLSYKNSGGMLTATDTEFNTLGINTNYGKVSYSGKANIINTKTIDGDMTFTLATFPTLNATSVTGNIDLVIKSKTGFHAIFSSINGLFSSGYYYSPLSGQKTRFNADVIYGDGGTVLSFETICGDFDIDYGNK